jgi:hypothetical protein
MQNMWALVDSSIGKYKNPFTPHNWHSLILERLAWLFLD